MSKQITAVFLVVVIFGFVLNGQGFVDLNGNGDMDDYENTELSFDIRVHDLVSRMTIAEKISQMAMRVPAIDRLGVPEYAWGSEALHGVMTDGHTVFPQAIAFAATWNESLVLECYDAIGDEARADYNLGKATTFSDKPGRQISK